VLDFGASRDREPADRLGRRIVVDTNGEEIEEEVAEENEDAEVDESEE
jgi:F-box and WD-40 domain protein CDC4